MASVGDQRHSGFSQCLSRTDAELPAAPESGCNPPILDVKSVSHLFEFFSITALGSTRQEPGSKWPPTRWGRGGCEQHKHSCSARIGGCAPAPARYLLLGHRSLCPTPRRPCGPRASCPAAPSSAHWFANAPHHHQWPLRLRASAVCGARCAGIGGRLHPAPATPGRPAHVMHALAAHIHLPHALAQQPRQHCQNHDARAF